MIRPARLAPMVQEINQPGGAVTPSIDAQVRAHLTKRALAAYSLAADLDE
jgi:hypothetical protein